MDEYIHNFGSGIGSADALFLAHFGAPALFAAKEIDKENKKSLYYQDLRKKRPLLLGAQLGGLNSGWQGLNSHE
jgi:hypothetical protein